MTPECFLDQFGHLADAPNGIAKLRELILQLAVRGKLVPQDPSDEPARVLLEKIRAEKEQLIIERRIRAGKPLPAISPEERPFELPIGWCWVRLGDVGDWGAGATPNRKDTSFYGGSVPWFKSGELTGGRLGASEEHVTEKALSECSLRLNKAGDVLIAMYGATIGKVAILDVEATTNQAICACTCFAGVSNSFFFYSSSLTRPCSLAKVQEAPNRIPREKIIYTVAALPPTKEQSRIVAKVDQLMALCDELEAKRNQRTDTHTRLVRAAHHPLTQARDRAELQTAWRRIRDNFDQLHTTLDAVRTLRQTILQLAVQGKLVPQDPRDEPASVLLEKIRAEKERLVAEGEIRKSESLRPIEPDNLPFEVPRGWALSRLDDVVVITGGVTKGRNLAGRKVVSVPYLRVANVQRGQLDLDQMKEIDIPEDELRKYAVLERDLVITEGGDWDKVGRTAIWRGELPLVAHQNHVFKARRVLAEQNEVWLEKYLNSAVA